MSSTAVGPATTGAGTTGLSTTGMSTAGGVGGASSTSAASSAVGGTLGAGGAGGTGVVLMPDLTGDAASTEGCERGPSIIETSCSLSGCHLDMREPNMVGDFISTLRDAGTRSMLCQRADATGMNEFRLLLDPANPADSYIIEKINPLPCGASDPTEGFILGFQMPLVAGTTNMSNPLSAEDIQCLTDWILAIAPP